MQNLGEDILNHYQEFLGDYVDVRKYTDSEHNIQLMGFNKKFENCITFASFGLSNYSEAIDNNCEVIMVVDADFDNCSTVLMNALFFMIQENIRFGRGTVIEGVDKISGNFSNLHDKYALYFTETYILPEEFSRVNTKCKMYMAFFISLEETQFIHAYGCERFEELLEERNADIIDINRNSVV